MQVILKYVGPMHQQVIYQFQSENVLQLLQNSKFSHAGNFRQFPAVGKLRTSANQKFAKISCMRIAYGPNMRKFPVLQYLKCDISHYCKQLPKIMSTVEQENLRQSSQKLFQVCRTKCPTGLANFWLDPPDSMNSPNFPVIKFSCSTVYASSYDVPYILL